MILNHNNNNNNRNIHYSVWKVTGPDLKTNSDLDSNCHWRHSNSPCKPESTYISLTISITSLLLIYIFQDSHETDETVKIYMNTRHTN